MPRNYNIYFNIGGGETRQSFNSKNSIKNSGSLSGNGSNISENGSNATNINLSRVMNIGLAFNLAQKGNELRGAYTQNRIQQRSTNTALTFAKYGLGIATLGVGGIIYAVGDLAYRGIQYNIDIQKKNSEAEYFRNLSGNNANSGSRYRGGYS